VVEVGPAGVEEEGALHTRVRGSSVCRVEGSCLRAR
jgi:hypothetical protein